MEKRENMLGLLALNSLGTTDIIFFIVLAALVVLCVGVYFLIPVLNKKQYREQRENLKKREAAFNSNVQRTDGAPVAHDLPAETEEVTPEGDLPTEQTDEEK